MKFPTAALPVLLLSCAAPFGPEEDDATRLRVATMPFRNLTDDPSIVNKLTRRLQLELVAQGLEFIPGEDLEQALRDARIRYTDSASAEDLSYLWDRLDMDYLLVGTVLSHQAAPRPQLALAARLLDARDGRRSRSFVGSLRGEDFEGLLGLGVIEEEADLLEEMAIRAANALHPLSDPLPLGESRFGSLEEPDRIWIEPTFRKGDMGPTIVLPIRDVRAEFGLEDLSPLVTELVTDSIRHLAGAPVVERSDLLAAMVAEEVRYENELDPQTLGRVGQRVGARYIVMGTLISFEERVLVGRWPVSEIELSLRILDTKTGSLVAAARLHRRGDDYHTWLGLGMEPDPVRLVGRAVDELVSSLCGA